MKHKNRGSLCWTRFSL